MKSSNRPNLDANAPNAIDASYINVLNRAFATIGRYEVICGIQQEVIKLTANNVIGSIAALELHKSLEEEFTYAIESSPMIRG